MSTATIKLFLPFGDPRQLRTAELSNWSGKALAAPRTDFDSLLQREELQKSGVYILTGTSPDTGKPLAYIGEAEILTDRLKAHKAKDFWVQAYVFTSKDENLTKGHIRYLEGRLIQDALKTGRFELANTQSSGAKLPESDREDMEVFLEKIHQLLPVLGSDILTPLTARIVGATQELTTTLKGLVAHGQRTAEGFVVFKDSQAVSELRRTAQPYTIKLREKLIADGTLVKEKDCLRFTKNTEFASPSAAASVVHGGSANGLILWKNSAGKDLKEIEGE